MLEVVTPVLINLIGVVLLFVAAKVAQWINANIKESEQKLWRGLVRELVLYAEQVLPKDKPFDKRNLVLEYLNKKTGLGEEELKILIEAELKKIKMGL